MDNASPRGLFARRTVLGMSALAGLASYFSVEQLFLDPAAAAPPISFGYPSVSRNFNDTWQMHRDRGSPGGTDFELLRGNNVYAMASGRVSVTYNAVADARGRYVRIEHGPMGQYSAVATESIHLSAIVVALNANVTRGQLIGKSGASGLGSENGYAQHLHVSGLFNGVNRDVQPYLSEGSGPEPVTPTPTYLEDDMFMVQQMSQSSPNYGIVMLVGPNGWTRLLSGAERDAYTTILGRAPVACVSPGWFDLVFNDQAAIRAYTEQLTT